MECHLCHHCFSDPFTGIIMIDSQLNILFVNHWITDRLPVNKRKATHLYELFDDLPSTGVQEIIQKVIITNNPRILSHAFHPWIIPLQDTRFPDGLMKQSAVVTPMAGHAVIRIRDESDTVLWTEAMKNAHTDIRRKGEQEQSVKRMQALGTLAGGVAHHFNTMLAVIVGNSELISHELNQDPVQGYHDIRSMLDTILHTCMGGKALVQQVLTFAHKHLRKKEATPIVATIMAAVEMVHSTLPPDIALNFSIHTLQKKMLGDRFEIQQIFDFLVTNAVEAMALTGGEIEIVVSEIQIAGCDKPIGMDLSDGSYLCLSFSDTGPGIKPELRDRVFEPFFTTKKGKRNVGMGLAVVNGIVTGNNGFIRLESEVGHGTRIEVYLPMTHEEDTEANLNPIMP
jgi:signal transduction histidine kinase